MTSILIKKSCGHIVQSGPGILMGDADATQSLKSAFYALVDGVDIGDMAQVSAPRK